MVFIPIHNHHPIVLALLPSYVSKLTLPSNYINPALYSWRFSATVAVAGAGSGAGAGMARTLKVELPRGTKHIPIALNLH